MTRVTMKRNLKTMSRRKKKSLPLDSLINKVKNSLVIVLKMQNRSMESKIMKRMTLILLNEINLSDYH